MIAALIVPTICGAFITYFVWSAFTGPRGFEELGAVRARLQIRHAQLASLVTRRKRLQHRIHLLEPGSVDPDMLEEVARNQLMEGIPGQVAVPRSAVH
ncbi:MAG: septum formation initiator family protein [Alphaproteobacteria bacterium]|nr:septum formation initiator family protein [Alphaproteobacteria bacterium]